MSTSQASQSIDKVESTISTFLNFLNCPACHHPQAEIVESEESVKCNKCNAEFPLIKCGKQSIPWLYEDPKLNLLEWKARLNGFLHLNQLEQHRLKQAQKDKRLSKTSQKRIDKLLKAKKQQVVQVQELLSPLNFDLQEEDSLSKALQSKTPKVQGLDSYYNNIFRDWAWENGENKQMLEAIDSVLSKAQTLGKVLTIGSGAGRLSYDLHLKYQVTYSVLMDINPLLMLSACQAIQGNEFKLHEFPIAPLNKNSFTTEQSCRAPVAVNENIFYVFGDGMNLPIKEKSFDTIVTPWLIDIIPQNLRDYIPRINAGLPVGGSWINTGSLAFFHNQQAWCYSEEEVLELVEKNGFEIVTSNRRTIQYLHSPLSAHGRAETVFTFHARKIKDVVIPPKYEYLPDWIRSPSIPIPKKYEQELNSSKHLLQAQVLGAIDGERSIEQIGELVAKQYNLQIDEATHAVRQILVNYYEEN
ncbi:MAG: hypothetical protein ACRBDX_00250 [Gammaproteobacteria bacterium]